MTANRQKIGPKIGLALGGGGVRGFAHAGVLEVLERERVPTDLIVGTSFGSIVGAMYSCLPSQAEVRKRLVKFLGDPQFEKARSMILRGSLEEGKRIRLLRQLKEYARQGVLFGLSLTKGFFISAEEFRKVLERLLPDIRMEQTQIPFRSVATELEKGDAVTLTEGPLIRAVQASCSFPGVFEPIRVDGKIFVDGGWSGPVPVPQARREGAARVIAVDTTESDAFSGGITSGLQVIIRSQNVTKRVLARSMLRQADVVIRPKIGHIHWTQFGQADECIELGREATVEALPSIRAMLDEPAVEDRAGNAREDFRT